MRKVSIERGVQGEAVHRPSDVLNALWTNRGLSQAPDYAFSSMLTPQLMGLSEAVAMLSDAIDRDQRILVVGDFDADGATATALAVDALKAMGAAHVDWLIPDRFRHGYGLSEKVIDEIGAPQPDVILTVDQGISAHEGVACAQARGMRVIVTDHHLPSETLPSADAIVNPNRADDPFGSKHLAGVGVVFYVMVALRGHLRKTGHFETRSEPRLDQWLDLVALGTVADLVTLDHNNRLLVAQGLARIRAGKTRPGIRALLEVAKRNLAHCTAADLGFAVAPRLNAAGRLEEMSVGVRCLLADQETAARPLAETLDAINQQRRALQATMQAQAHEQAKAVMAEQTKAGVGLCLFDPSWHQGVVGLVAGQVAEKLQCPVVAFAIDEENPSKLKGSGRSPSGVHMRDLLVEIDRRAPGVIDQFGGHSGAAGLTLDKDALVQFEQAFNRIAEDIPKASEVVRSDGVLPAELLTDELALMIEHAGPWGQGFSEPLFDGAFEVVDRRVVGGEHLKLSLRVPNGTQVFDAIAFRAATLASFDLPEPWHITYRLDVNRWRGQQRVQLIVQHWVERVLDSA
ncbi:MAG: single-stranded-DNA-specific exonuclease RecJ [Wenzhouxiangella sp.]|nr:single-stranded-DNA-specific exonuclease RecJ [Wenzhouxiangella sp.]